jgi:tetratricopeptide (TPR) repeat protein
MRKETDLDSPGWYQLGQILFKTGRFDKARQLYEGVLAAESEKGLIYYEIGSAKDHQVEYGEATKYYQKALDTYQKTLPPNHPDLSMPYSSIGTVYLKWTNNFFLQIILICLYLTADSGMCVLTCTNTQNHLFYEEELEIEQKKYSTEPF